MSLIDVELLCVLQDLRNWVGEPVRITGNRCPGKNAAVPGASTTSKHMHAKAADVSSKYAMPNEIYNYLDKTYPHEYGIGLYDSWVHIDVRRKKTRWDKRSKK